jgi:sn-glycerol 3-phosphate transport system permease protein
MSLLLAVMANRVVRGRWHLQDPADLALRRGAGGGRRAVAVHVRLALWRGPLRLRQMGIDWNHLLNGGHAMALIVMASVWKQISYNFLFFLAGLQSIPQALIEAAAIDGATPWKRFWTIVFPLLSPTTFFLLVINVVLRVLRHLRHRRRRHQGGPGKDTAILVYKVYYDGFKAMDIGGSAAQSVVLMAIVIALTVIQFRYVEKKVQY